MTLPNRRPVIIRKLEDESVDGHHGGAWKVAYADFMTAMMAFFLLMWILSTATKDQLNGVADYFTPSVVAMTSSGGTGALDGSALGPKGVRDASTGLVAATGTGRQHALKAPKPPAADAKGHASASGDPTAPIPPKTGPVGKADAPAGKVAPAGAKAKDTATAKAEAAAMRAAENQRFTEVQHEIVQAMTSAPDLRPLLKNVRFQRSDQGLEIQIVDQAGRALFASGSAKISGETRVLLDRLGRSIADLPNKIRIAGHTDSVPYADGAAQDNWVLSSERANATRRALIAAGVAQDRIIQISGLADTQPLDPKFPNAPENRRISVLLTYDTAKAPAETLANGAAEAGQGAVQPAVAPRDRSGTAPAVVPDTPASPSPAGDSTSVEAKAATTPATSPAALPTALAQKNAVSQEYVLVTLKDLSRGLD